MRIRAVLSATLASVGILVVGWQSGTHVTTTASAVGTAAGTNGAGSNGAGSGATGSSGSAGSPTSSSGSTGPTGAPAAAGATFAGSVVQTRFGPVQVQIAVGGSTISNVAALQLTNEDRRSVQISNYAAPLLRSEVLRAQSAKVQTISGATVTSSAYLTSLQSALDAAHL
ncbi:FMN-binding protein [Arthrobacter sp. UYEF3]|uniref:FMN-binding protein n=1 Tax=Arthrobacter sp. UYEF3 TaxID=1756365 RepID=UPI003393D7B5